MRRKAAIVFAVTLAMVLAACASTAETAFAIPLDCQLAKAPSPATTPWSVPSGRPMSQDCMERIENSRSDAPPR